MNGIGAIFLGKLKYININRLTTSANNHHPTLYHLPNQICLVSKACLLLYRYNKKLQTFIRILYILNIVKYIGNSKNLIYFLLLLLLL